MSEIAGITFGAAAPLLAPVVANGVCGDDPRVLAACNAATKVLLSLPGAPWVGTMATYDVTATGITLFLPKELENGIEFEVLNGAPVRGQTDVTEGGYNLVSNSEFVDPSQAHDNPVVDLFLQRDPTDHTILRRKYDYPGLQNNAVVRVTGMKRYIPLVADGDTLIIQHIEALKSAILYLEYKERGPGSINDAKVYLEDARMLLEGEKQNHQLDPRRALARKANYQQDIITYPEGTLGRTRGRLALELPGFLLKGKAEITYLVNRAVQMLVDNWNQLAISGRLSVHGGVTEVEYVPATRPDTQLLWDDYNDIRLMIQGFITEGPDPNAMQVADAYQKQAFESQKLKLIEETDRKRHTTYTQALSTYVSGTFGWMVARLALEMKDGLMLTTTELERLVSMAEMRLMERSIYKGTIGTLSATVTGGDILFPRDVEAVLAADICGHSLDLRSIYFAFQKNGPGFHYHGCQAMFRDMGEVYFPQTGAKRRKYFFTGSTTNNHQLKAVVKYRWEQKESCDEMRVKNFEAIRLFAEGIHGSNMDKMNEAIGVLEREMSEHLSGLAITANVDISTFGFAGIGARL